MSFIAYLYNEAGSTPYMEVLGADTMSKAKAQTERLLSEHLRATYAELRQDDALVAVITRQAPAAA